ncbi:hypothetical protein [Nocardioides sp. MH1]|uniref:hypothetical protein n=1 Tax=Nocardioides sp. MH1 TaxID=3242490 RepID=UPI003523108F
MAEHVIPLDLGVTWEPNAPAAVLVTNNGGGTALALRAHRDDGDQRCVVIVWTGTSSASLSSPNDEAISGHRLYSKGLSDVLWAGSVTDSEAVAALEIQNRVHPYHDASRFDALQHHVVLAKERVAEVVAETLEVRRSAGSTLQAATSALHTR